MRNKFLWAGILCLSVLAFVACSGGNEGPTEDPLPESLTITVDKEVLLEDSSDSFWFTVKGDDGKDYSAKAEFYINGTKNATGNNLKPAGNSGVQTVYAQMGTVKSNEIKVSIIGANYQFDGITIASNVTKAFELETISFTAMGKMQGAPTTFDITNLITLYVDGVAVTGTTYTFPSAKTYTVQAKMGSQTSNTISVEAATLPQSFAHKVLIEDFTGTWCGFCPRVLHSIDLVHAQSDDVVVAAIHQGSDPFTLSVGGTLAKALWDKFSVPSNYRGYPYVVINRSVEWDYPEYNHVSQPIEMVTASSPYGFSIFSSLDKSGGTIEVAFALREALPSAKCVVYVLEDDLKYNQVNYYSTSYQEYTPKLYGGVNPIVDFPHQDVARVAATNILGDAIPADKTEANSVYRVFYNAKYTSVDVSKLKIMAILLDASGNVVNVRVVPANTAADFE